MNKIKNFFMNVVKFFDKVLITPISRIIYNLNKKIKGHKGLLEKLLNKPKVLIYVSLVMAIGVFFLINSKVISLVETQAEIISDQPVNLIYNEEAYVVEGAPSTVDITLIGRTSDLYLAKQLGEYEVTLDLTGYKVGEHKVYFSYTQSIDSINYKLDPSYVLVIIKEKVSTIKTLTYDVLNQDKLDSKLSVGDITLDRSEVVVKGSQETLNKVATVKALVDLNNDQLKEAGEYDLNNVQLVAYDENGAALKNVEIVPSTISVKLELDSFSAEVPLKIVTSGTPATGAAIASLSPNVSKVTVYGSQEVVSNLEYIPVTIDVDGLSADKSYNVTISKPAGVRYMSTTTVNINTTVGTETSKEISGVSIETRNVGSGLNPNAATPDDASITVIAKGVSNVLDDVAASNLVAYVDLTGYTVGTYDVPVQIESSDPKVQFVSKVKTISIVLTNK